MTTNQMYVNCMWLQQHLWPPRALWLHVSILQLS